MATVSRLLTEMKRLKEVRNIILMQIENKQIMRAS
jgi:hypothetical protein